MKKARNNLSTISKIILFLCIVGFVLLLMCIVRAVAQTNPIKTPVNNAAELYTCLKYSRAGDTLVIPNAAKWRIQSSTVIPSGVTLLSKGGMLYNDSMYTDQDYKAMLITMDHVTLKGLVLKGASADIGDHANKWCIGVRNEGTGFTMDSCEVYAWNKMGVWLRFQDSCDIGWSYIHHCRGASLGYGIWTGGAGQDSGKSSNIHNNLFDNNRSAIDASGHKNSYTFQNNCIQRQSLYYPIKRHGSNDGYYGGRNTRILNNIVQSTQQSFELPFPWDKALCEVSGNYFTRQDSDSLAPAGKIGAEFYWKVRANHPEMNIVLKDNHFGGEGMAALLPNAEIVVPKTRVKKLELLRFSSKTKQKKYIWRFGTGDVYGNEQRTASYDMRFPFIGGYTVSLVTVDSLNRASFPANKVIYVESDSLDTKTYLVFNMKDSYSGNLSNFYFKQLVVDTTKVLWQDDVGGDEGWQRVVQDISQYTNDGKKHIFSFRIYCKVPITSYKTQIQELDVYLDDVSIVKGSQITYWNMEGSAKLPPGWGQVTQSRNPQVCPSHSFSTTVTTAEARSGEQSLRIGIPYGATTCTNFYGEFYFQIQLN